MYWTKRGTILHLSQPSVRNALDKKRYSTPIVAVSQKWPKRGTLVPIVCITWLPHQCKSQVVSALQRYWVVPQQRSPISRKKKTGPKKWLLYVPHRFLWRIYRGKFYTHHLYFPSHHFYLQVLSLDKPCPAHRCPPFPRHKHAFTLQFYRTEGSAFPLLVVIDILLTHARVLFATWEKGTTLTFWEKTGSIVPFSRKISKKVQHLPFWRKRCNTYLFWSWNPPGIEARPSCLYGLLR